LVFYTQLLKLGLDHDFSIELLEFLNVGHMLSILKFATGRAPTFTITTTSTVSRSFPFPLTHFAHPMVFLGCCGSNIVRSVRKVFGRMPLFDQFWVQSRKRVLQIDHSSDTVGTCSSFLSQMFILS